MPTGRKSWSCQAYTRPKLSQVYVTPNSLAQQGGLSLADVLLVLLAAERATCLMLFKSAQGAYVCPNNLAQQGRFSLAGVTLVLFHAVEPATRFMLLQFPQECACPNSPAQQGGFSLAGVTLVLLHAGARATCFMLLGVPSKTAQNWCVQSAQLHVAVLFLRRLQTCVMIFTSFAFSQTIFSLNVMRAQSWLCKHTRHSAHFWLEDGFEVAGGG